MSRIKVEFRWLSHFRSLSTISYEKSYVCFHIVINNSKVHFVWHSNWWIYFVQFKPPLRYLSFLINYFHNFFSISQIILQWFTKQFNEFFLEIESLEMLNRNCCSMLTVAEIFLEKKTRALVLFPQKQNSIFFQLME